MAHPKVKISDNSGNEVGVTDNRLDVNVAGATIETGDIDVNLDSATDSVEAVLSATDNAVLDGIKAAVEIIDNAVSGNEMQVDIVTNKHPEGMTSITTFNRFDVDTSAIQLSSADGINSSPTNCKEIIIHSLTGNDGYIFVGDSSVNIDNNGIRVNAGETLILPLAEVADIWLDGSSANQWVAVTLIRDI